MKNTIFLVALFCYLPLFGLTQTLNEEAAVKAAIQQLFDGMRAGDSSRVRAVFYPGARMQTVFYDQKGNPSIREASLEAFLQQIGTPRTVVFDERIRRYEIRVDDLLATAWTEYAFYLDSDLRHCGTNAFQLFKSADGWKITQITDTRHTKGCEPIPSELAVAKMNYEHPIPFAPEEYVCYRTETPITLDGKLEEAAWQAAPWTNDFVDIEGELKPEPRHRTRAKMLWDDEYFYFGAVLEEPHIWATLTERDAIIFQDDDFEIFIDPDGDGHNYYEFEMNALNTVWDLLMLWPYHLQRGDNHVFNWNNPGLETAVHIEGTLNDPGDEDQYWSVEVAFPWSALKELAPGRSAPRPGHHWRVNFSRVDWHVDIEDGKYLKQIDPATGQRRREENWVWSPTGRIDMHRPEAWAFVQFSDKTAGEGEETFRPGPEEGIKWALRQLFYQQRQFYEQYGRYSADVTHFTIPEVEGVNFAPRFSIGTETFEISAPAAGFGHWYIDHTGKIWQKY